MKFTNRTIKFILYIRILIGTLKNLYLENYIE